MWIGLNLQKMLTAKVLILGLGARCWHLDARTVKKLMGPEYMGYCENINRENPKMANP